MTLDDYISSSVHLEMLAAWKAAGVGIGDEFAWRVEHEKLKARRWAALSDDILQRLRDVTAQCEAVKNLHEGAIAELARRHDT